MNIDRRTLPLTALRAFEAFGRLGSMSAAAASLGVTHSAVSRQIRQLEDLLGVTLTTGPRSATRPSATGLLLLPALARGFDALEDALRALPRTADSVDVSSLATFAMRWLIPRLHGFQALHPQLRVRLTSDHAPVDTSASGPDVAIRVGTGAWPAGYAVTPLFADLTGPVVAPALAAQVTPDFAHVPRLSSSSRVGTWEDWAHVAGHRLAPAKDTVFEHFHYKIEAALSGLGAAVLPEALIRNELAAGRLIAPYGFLPTGMEYVALLRPNPSRPARQFRDWLVEAARA
ncbi:LysR substrate-binding domain-containing protein [Pararhodobacter zhoushanensis]|uniref:LysR substrate-binding domain-containing protein n=1 Tax=Pararhodobacter zhoushanensis TaxID=2479545 RepID=UPI000F8E06EE|nr:LysR substrate-binding domain-containing protein [Pararhodobacter zhoushanensis]